MLKIIELRIERLTGARRCVMRFLTVSIRNFAKPVLGCVLAVLSTGMMAQQASPPQSSPKLAARTELVTVPVVVLRQGSPFRQLLIRGQLDEHVTGLTKDDFSIEQDGQAKPIATFEEISASNFPIKRPTPPRLFTIELIPHPPARTPLILLH